VRQNFFGNEGALNGDDENRMDEKRLGLFFSEQNLFLQNFCLLVSIEQECKMTLRFYVLSGFSIGACEWKGWTIR
jgi:hypothetical protein